MRLEIVNELPGKDYHKGKKGIESITKNIDDFLNSTDTIAKIVDTNGAYFSSSSLAGAVNKYLRHCNMYGTHVILRNDECYLIKKGLKT